MSSCPPSCSSPQPPGPSAAIGLCREECVGGCECPPGLYLHRGICLKKDDCPCYHRRRTYQPGDKIQQRCNTWWASVQIMRLCFLFIYIPLWWLMIFFWFCDLYFIFPSSLSVCKTGEWQCTSEKCEGQCTLIGAVQITTFDKKQYLLNGGNCPFIAVEVSHKHLSTEIQVYTWWACPFFSYHLCFQDFVDRKLVVGVQCGECTAAAEGGGGGQMGCLKEMSVTVLHTTVTITNTGELVNFWGNYFVH